jgi:16S rRNA (guanine527-N7)-methyltransferase
MINFNIEKIVPLCQEFGVEITDKIAENLNKYGNLLLEWNEKINLTAITEPEEVLYKHFYDCILFFKNVDVPQNAKIIDVGTGAGFPGMVLAIARPDIKLCLLDSLNKRVNFLCEVLSSLGLSAEAVHLRAEEGARKPEHREQYDIACARAVAALPTLLELALPFVRPGGRMMAFKGPSLDEELASSEKALKKLCAQPIEAHSISIPGRDWDHRLMMIRKTAPTPKKFPRKAGEAGRNPLI